MPTPDQYVIFARKRNISLLLSPRSPRIGAPGRQHHGMKPERCCGQGRKGSCDGHVTTKDGKIAKASKVTEAKVARVSVAGNSSGKFLRI